MYYVNEAGKLSVNSFTRSVAGLNFIDSLTLADGVVNVGEWSLESRYLYTMALISWGSGVVVSGDGGTIDPNSAAYIASEDENLSAYVGSGIDDFISGYISSNGAYKYGELWFKGRDIIQNKSGQPRLAKKAHFPFSFSPHNTSGYYTPIRNWFLSDSQPRRFVTITQDFRGLDWGIGTNVLDVQVTDDNETIADTWCIKRTYDFNRLTVTSVLMERPANT
jgi:hypothetical protein